MLLITKINFFYHIILLILIKKYEYLINIEHEVKIKPKRIDILVFLFLKLTSFYDTTKFTFIEPKTYFNLGIQIFNDKSMV
jgi:hypothetical protein